MSTLKLLKNRHSSLDNQLINEWNRVIFQAKSKNKIAVKIAYKFDLSSVTVINYGQGAGSDGFLKEAILEELKGI